MQARSPATRSAARSAVGLGLVAATLAGLVALMADGPVRSRTAQDAPGAASAPVPQPSPAELGHFSLPSGAPLGIACVEAQRVTLFMQRELSTPAIAPLPFELVEAWAGLLDPHGLWTAAPDSPVRSELAAAAGDMLVSLHQRSSACLAAERVAAALQPWVAELARVYDAAFDAARLRAALPAAEVFRLAAEPIFQDDPVLRPAVELAQELGSRSGAFVARFPDEAALAEQARARFFPQDARLLREMVTLAALRAYVPLVDPHGDFAALGAEWGLYAGDATLDAGSPLWADVIRTPLGARIVQDPAPPLEVDDLVLSINGLWLAGASVDQIEQAARSLPVQGKMELRVLRQGADELLRFEVGSPELERLDNELELERIPFGAGQSVLRIGIPDVGDWLGEDLAQVLARDSDAASAVLLDLRGNGGGSLDAAVEALGLLVPGAPLFPLIRRGQVVELLRAPRPAWHYLGPVAALVDGDTASAAEMIAGGLQAYERGPVIGARTFGKGCVQEYFDDVTSAGVLRLTTLQFVMPSGKPLQQIGLTPDLALPLPASSEREATITRQPISFEGPDVRAASVRPGPAWPSARGAVGPCEDALVCAAILRLSSPRPAPRAARSRPGTW